MTALLVFAAGVCVGLLVGMAVGKYWKGQDLDDDLRSLFRTAGVAQHLSRYAEHKMTCSTYAGEPCDCGLASLLPE